MDDMVFDRKNFLKLLEEDEEFRYAVAGKIGLLEILEKLREQNKKFNEILEELRVHRKKLLEHDKHFQLIENKLLEHDKRFEAIEKKLLEHDKRFEAIERKLLEHDKKFYEILEELRIHRRKLLEHDKRFEAIEKKLLEHDKRFEALEKKLLEHDEKFDKIHMEIKRIWEELRRHKEILDRHTRMLGSLGNDIGALTEATLSRFVRDDVIDEIKMKGEKIIEIKRMYMINGYEVDLYIETDKTIYVVEVKTRPSIEDVKRLSRIKEYLMEKTSKEVKMLLVTLRAKTTLDILSEARKHEIELLAY